MSQPLRVTEEDFSEPQTIYPQSTGTGVIVTSGSNLVGDDPTAVMMPDEARVVQSRFDIIDDPRHRRTLDEVAERLGFERRS